jgi:hypothetical protein
MGMTCSLHRVSVDEVEQVRKNPDTLARVLGFDQGPRVREVRPKGILGFLLRLTPITITEVDPDAPETINYVPDTNKEFDLEKAWNGLHFLFTGTSDEGREPSCFLLKGGEGVDDEGLARALSPDQVKRFAAFLASLTPDQLRGRFDAKRMMKLEIYPEIWDRPVSDDENTLEWLIAYFTDLQSFVQRVADDGDAIVVYLST